MTVRLLNPADIAAERRLWHTCFPDDTEAFLDWFFKSGRASSLSAGCFEGERLVSAMHGTLMPLTCSGKTLPALMVSGVGTEPEERGKGYMHRTMLFLKEKAAERGIRILFNHPQDPNAYKRLGFLPCTDTLYFEEPMSFFTGEGDGALQAVSFSQEAARSIYGSLTKRYSAFSVRDVRAFSLRVSELMLDGGKAFLFLRKGAPEAYCLCHREGCMTVADEVLALSDYAPVLAAVGRATDCERIRAKLPPDTALPGEIRVQNIMLTDAETYASFGYGKDLCYSVDEY